MDLWQRWVTDSVDGPVTTRADTVLTSPGDVAVGDGRRGLLTLLFTIPPKPILLQAEYNPAVYCNLIKLNTKENRWQRMLFLSSAAGQRRTRRVLEKAVLPKSYYVQPSNFLHLHLERQGQVLQVAGTWKSKCSLWIKSVYGKRGKNGLTTTIG